MKNFLIKALYQITPEQVDFITSGKMLVDNFQNYQEMHRLSIKSFRQNLQDDWELIELTGNITGLQKSFQHTMREIKHIWYKNYPCNILYTDCDTLCVRPLKIFGRFPEFRLFSSRSINRGGHFNCGVRYYPSTIKKDVWDLQDKLMEKWPAKQYSAEQDIYNVMVWSQPNLRYHPNCLFQDDVVDHKYCSTREPHEIVKGTHSILHFLSSRHPDITLDLMTKSWNLLDNSKDKL